MNDSPESLTLSGGVPGFFFSVLDGTNAEARRRIAAGAAADCWIIAERQTSGRGRRGRAWLSEPGNIYISRLMQPGCPPARAAELSFVTALAVHDLARGELGANADVACKWPNDVLVRRRKLSGILLESEGAGDWLVIGIGINVAHAPEGVEFPATCLMNEGGARSARELIAPLAAAFDARLQQWREGGFAAIRAAWREVATGIGGPVRVRLHDREIHGRFDDIDETGALLLTRADGGTERIAAGDVFFP